MYVLASLRLLRLLRTRTGRYILIALFGFSTLIGLIISITDRPAPPYPPPIPTSTVPETLNITLTWDQWADLQNAAWFIADEISITLTLAGHTLPPSTVEEAHATIDRFDNLKQGLIDQAFEQTTHVPDEEITLILDHQLERQENLVNLLNTLDQARLDWLTETLQP